MGCPALKYYPKADLKISHSKKELTLKNSSKKERSKYLFGFNGVEKENDLYGEGNAYTTFFRAYNPRLARWMSIDPKADAWQSPYTSMDNNPINLADPMGDDVVNGNTAKKQKAAGNLKKADKALSTAQNNFKQYNGKTKGDFKGAERKAFKQAEKSLNQAQAKKDYWEAELNNQIELEKITDQVIEEFRNTNPEKFAEWDKFNPTGTGVIDINVSAQNLPIQILDNNGFPTGKTTTEGINARIGSSNDYIKLRLKVIKVNDVVKIQAMTSVLVHGLGHVEGGKHRDENQANKYQIENYDNLIKKRKK